jgi:hypothetical protein
MNGTETAPPQVGDSPDLSRPGERLRRVSQRIAAACDRAGRDPETVRLLAVGKQHPAGALRALFELGQRAFGENRLQEALGKQEALADLAMEWHFIGPVQSNKTRAIAAHFHWVQSVDREKLLRRLSRQRPPERTPLNILLEVNIDREPQKAGLAPEQLPALAELARELPGLRLRGLMCIPAWGRADEATRTSFSAMRALYESLRKEGHELDTLSMGMSGDLELAILEGSTMVRVGTDLFGPRPGDMTARAGSSDSP